jgi:fatty-acyl-CoA synthase
MRDLASLGLLASPARPALPAEAQDVSGVVARAAREAPDREALVGRHLRLGFGELERAANRAAYALGALGVRPGDAVAACMGNHPELCVALRRARSASAPQRAVGIDETSAKKRPVGSDKGVSGQGGEGSHPGCGLAHLEAWDARYRERAPARSVLSV